MLGALGDIVFVASPELLRTFQDFTRKTKPRLTKHEVHLQYPVTEYLGPDLDQITFRMRFDSQFGVEPRAEMTNLLVLCRAATPMPLQIGGLPMGADKWIITSLGQQWTTIDGKGEVLTGEVDVTLEEYIT